MGRRAIPEDVRSRRIEIFLSHLAEHGSVRQAAIKAGFPAGEVYEWRAASPSFAESWQKAKTQGQAAAKVKKEASLEPSRSVGIRIVCREGQAHHWVIKEPAGPFSEGRCLHCSATAEFANWLPSHIWESLDFETPDPVRLL